MSDSDTDSLEFESADEGQNDINLDDISDISDLDDDNISSSNKNKQIKVDEIKKSEEKSLKPDQADHQELVEKNQIDKNEEKEDDHQDKIDTKNKEINEDKQIEVSIESIKEPGESNGAQEKDLEKNNSDPQDKNENLVDRLANFNLNQDFKQDETNLPTVSDETEKLEVNEFATYDDKEIEETEKIKNEKIEEKDQDPVKEEIENSTEHTEIKNKELKTGWDDDELAIEDELLDDNNHKEEVKQVDQPNKSEPVDLKQETQIISADSWGQSGWDDADIDDDALLDEKKIEIFQNRPEISTKPNQDELPKQVKDETQPETNQGGGWSWSKIGTNFLSSAVSLTTQLGGAVLETVESTLGAPDPLELARLEAEKKLAEKEEMKSSNSDDKIDNSWENDDSQEWFTLPQLTKITSTGSQLVIGSLDVLESVGKKTIEVLNDKDPNLKGTREFLKKVPTNIVPIAQKPNLSQLLREAQQNQKLDNDTVGFQKSPSSQFAQPSSPTSKSSKPQKPTVEKLTFSLFFEEYKGGAHLEALEMLSREASLKLEMLSLNKSLSSQSSEFKNKLSTLESIFDADRLNDDSELDDESSCSDDFKLLLNKEKIFDVEHFEFLINDYSRRTNLKLIIDKIIGAFRTTSYASKEIMTSTELYNELVKCFALITSNIVELYHKAAESLLIEQKNPNKSKPNRFSPSENAQTLYQITRLFIRSVTILADDFSRKCKTSIKDKFLLSSSQSPNQVITEIYLEASNVNTYVSDAFLLFLPLFKSQILED